MTSEQYRIKSIQGKLELAFDIVWNIDLYHRKINEQHYVLEKGLDFLHAKAIHNIDIYNRVIARLEQRLSNILKQTQNEV